MFNAEKQTLFTISLNHIRKQGGASIRGFVCAYRGDNGRSCAAAPFIANYSEKMEEKNFRFMANTPTFARALDPVAVAERDFVFDLQVIHDEAARATGSDEEFLKLYEPRMHEYARRWELIVPPRVAMGARTY